MQKRKEGSRTQIWQSDHVSSVGSSAEKATSDVASRGSDEARLNEQVEKQFNMTEQDLNEAKEFADTMSLEEVRKHMEQVLKLHHHDPNFPTPVLEKIRKFVANDDVFADQARHADLIYEMKLEAALIRNNSPYAEVRAVVDNHDDPATPCGTIRAWVIGLLFALGGAFINQLFSIRQPAIGVGSNVAQLLAYPLGKACERFLPDKGFTAFGVYHSLNPGPFSKKEHMLITIMANVAFNTPYTNNVIWVQYLPQYFNQSFAGSFAYQLVIAIATNFIGYGMAGLTRSLLVYPSYCVWPASLVTVALNSAFHKEENVPVVGPAKRVWRMSRYKFFMITFAAMFAYFWLPDYFFQAMSYFSWITWIAPDNVHLAAVSGMQNGLGLNPLSTFDWNIVGGPLTVPFFATINSFAGSMFSFFIVLGLWYSNAYYTGYLPINSNRVFDNTGHSFNVSRAVDGQALYDAAKYAQYSPAYLTAGNMTNYLFFFALYPATLTYVVLYHRHDLALAWRNLTGTFRKRKSGEPEQYDDVHNRLMSKYQEVPHWWYFSLLLVAVGCGVGGIAGWPTFTTPGVVLYGVVLCLVFVVPIGVVTAMTGMEVGLNVLAEFIGGAWAEGNALAMNYFKSFGYVTCAGAIGFANDLKLAHYLKIPPRQTFSAQVVATLVSTLVCVGILNFQMNAIPGVCTPQAANHFTCPGINTFFTASVLWGTIGPRKVFGAGGQYTALMVGWPLGVLVVLGFWLLQRRFGPGRPWMRQIHPILVLTGGMIWAPYNISYVFPAVPVAWLSWIWLKNRHLAFWSKYNYVLSASFSTAIAIAGIVIFFAVQWTGLDIDWWGNQVIALGCEDTPCRRLELAEGAHFGPGPGQFLT